MIEKCIRCGKPTSYHPNIAITLRRYFVEGSGQLCDVFLRTLSGASNGDLIRLVLL